MTEVGSLVPGVSSREKSGGEMIQLGDVARDQISGFEGVVVAITQWLNGCRRITIQPNKLDKDGKMLENETFDENQVEVLPAKKKPVVHLKRTGGPRPRPTRNVDPR